MRNTILTFSTLFLLTAISSLAQNTDYEYLADISIEEIEQLIKTDSRGHWFANGKRIYVNSGSFVLQLLDGDMNIIDLHPRSHCSVEQLDGEYETKYFKVNETNVRMIERCFEHSNLLSLSKKLVISLSPASKEGKAYMIDTLKAGQSISLTMLPTTEEQAVLYRLLPPLSSEFSADGFNELKFGPSEEEIKRRAENKANAKREFEIELEKIKESAL